MNEPSNLKLYELGGEHPGWSIQVYPGWLRDYQAPIFISGQRWSRKTRFHHYFRTASFYKLRKKINIALSRFSTSVLCVTTLQGILAERTQRVEPIQLLHSRVNGKWGSEKNKLLKLLGPVNGRLLSPRFFLPSWPCSSKYSLLMIREGCLGPGARDTEMSVLFPSYRRETWIPEAYWKERERIDPQKP